MIELKGKSKSFSLHFILLIIFFLSNGYKDYPGLISWLDIFLYLGTVGIISSIFYLFFSSVLKSNIKSGLLTSTILFFYFFYGAIQDFCKRISFLHSFGAHRYLLPFIIILLFIVYRYLRKTKQNFYYHTLYINCLLLIYISFDIFSITFSQYKISRNILPGENQLSAPAPINLHGRTKPDIFFILVDEYTGSRMLKKYFHYDNSRFQNFLKENGFFVATNPSSNYSSTPFSMAATFNMNYLNWIEGDSQLLVQDYSTAVKKILENESIHFLERAGYTIVNNSIFDIGKEPSPFNSGLLPLNLKLITAKTLSGRIQQDLFWRVKVRNGNGFEWLKLNNESVIGDGNEKMLMLTRKAISDSSANPRFIYTHLLMPHLPFLYDSLGKLNKPPSNDNSYSGAKKDNEYLQYLVYTNSVISTMVNDIMKKKNRQAVIIIMSDHGYRDYSTKTSSTDINNNFNAVFLPTQDYHLFNDSISNVNQFRILFNSLFDQDFSILKNRVVF